MIGKKEFAKMKKGAGLINASRGGVIDEESLLDALDSGQLSFAGLDTFVNEPKPRTSILDHLLAQVVRRFKIFSVKQARPS